MTKEPGQDQTHHLTPLLEPRSIALVGASPRCGSVGHSAARALLSNGFEGRVHLINPRHGEIEGQACVASLADLEAPPDLAILSVGASRMEAVFTESIAAGARSFVIFDDCHGRSSCGGALKTRLKDIAREANVPVCGGNGMGFFNVPARCNASFYPADHLVAGGITLIAHSGSVFTVLALNDPRYRFDLVISSGQEIGTTIDEYMDFALERESTRVIALFMEAARDPGGFVEALKKARNKGVPVVVCKVARTQESARLAETHSGALAGNGVSYDAVLERYGAIKVGTVDQLMNTAMLLSYGRFPLSGGLGLITDSGGLRELTIDRASEFGDILAPLSDETHERLRAILPDVLTPSNPLDCAGPLVDDFTRVFEQGLETFGAVPEIGMLGYEFDARDDYLYDEQLLELALRLPKMTAKPCFAYTCFSQTNNRSTANRLADAGVPLINGLDEMLAAARAVFSWRDCEQRAANPDPLPEPPDQTLIEKWRKNLAGGGWVGEADALGLLEDFGLPVVPYQFCCGVEDVRLAAERLSYPLVIKTAVQGIAHKADVAGVATNIANFEQLESAYSDFANRLGDQVIVQEMVAGAPELAFGCVNDPDFGPLVMVSAGGALIEILQDRRFALAPFGENQALHMIEQLQINALLEGARNTKPVDKQQVAQTLARFSMLCASLGDVIQEIDINPFLINDNGLVAVDALIIPRG